MKTTKFLLLAFGACLLTGCELFHKCPPPEVSTECYPLCRNDRKDNRFLCEKNWNGFKNFKTIKYKPVGLPLVDDMSKIISKLSYQITKEIVIPYVELDSEGLICAYQEYQECVNDVMEQQKCDVRKASELVWADWMKYPGGKEKCVKLYRAIPLIHRLRADQQIARAMARIQPEVDSLSHKLLTFGLKWNKIKRELKDKKIIMAGMQVAPNVLQLSLGVSYLVALKAQQSEQTRAMENYILSVQEFYKAPAK